MEQKEYFESEVDYEIQSKAVLNMGLQNIALSYDWLSIALPTPDGRWVLTMGHD